MKKGLFLLLFIASNIFAACSSLTVNALDTATGEQGFTAVYPITLTNTGQNSQLSGLSGICPDDLDCHFEPIAFQTLVPSETKTFNLVVDTASTPSGNYVIPVTVSESSNTCQTLSLNLEVKANASASALQQVTAVLNPTANQSTRPGEKIEYSISIYNSGAEKVYATLENQGAFTDTTAFSYNEVEIASGESKDITVRITVPPATPYGKYSPVFLVKTVTNSGCCQKTFTLPSQIFVFAPKLDLVIQGEPTACLLLIQNEKREMNFTFRNDGEIVGPFEILIEGTNDAKKILTLEKTLLEVKKQDKQPLHISLDPTIQTPLGSYNFNLVLNYLGTTVTRRPYCYYVDAKTDFVVKTSDEYSLERGTLNELEYEIENTGTASINFFAEAIPHSGFQLSTSPSQFTILAKDKRKLKLLAATTLEDTPLGKANFTVLITSGKLSKRVDFATVTYSSTKKDRSFLSIPTYSLTAIAGVKTTQFVQVTNTKSGVLKNVSLEISGIPQEWIEQKTPWLDILGGRTASFEIVFDIPKEEQSDKGLSLTASSAEGEKTTADARLKLIQPNRVLQASVENLVYQNDRIVITIRAFNPGQVRLTSITPSATGFVITSDASNFDLEPGETRIIIVTANKNQDKDIPLTLSSSQGAVTQMTIPGKQTAQENTNRPSLLFTAIIVLVLLLIALAFFIRKEKLEQAN